MPQRTLRVLTNRWKSLVLGAFVALAAGCASPLSLDPPSFSLKEARLEREIAKQAERDPFPTPQEAGIRDERDSSTK